MKKERVTLNNLEKIGEGSFQRSAFCPFESSYLDFRAADGIRYRWYTEKISLKSGHYWLSCFVSDENTLSRVKVLGSILDSEAAED